MTDSHFRAAAALTPDFTGRTVEGLLVPYSLRSTVNSPGWSGTESFAPGAFDHQLNAPHRIPLYMDHGPLGGKLIGRMTGLRSDVTSSKPGLYGTAIVSDTSDGRDALALLKDGVYPDFSVGFREVPGQQIRQADGSILRKKANLFELALVREGAYGPAGAQAALRAMAGDRCASCGQFGMADDHVGGDATRSDQDAFEPVAPADLLASLGLRPLPLPPMPS